MRYTLGALFAISLAAAPGFTIAQQSQKSRPPSPQAACDAGVHLDYKEPGVRRITDEIRWEPNDTKPGAYFCRFHRELHPPSPTILMDFTLQGTRDRVTSLSIVGEVINGPVPVAFRQELRALASALIEALGGKFDFEVTLPMCVVALCSHATFGSNIGEGTFTEHIEDETRDGPKVYQYTIQIDVR